MSDIQKLLDIMVALRRDCPWDRGQTLASIAPYTVEEAYEVADAIAREDPDALRGELGDLLFQVVFHARMAEDDGQFAFGDVVDAICDKMVRRHPHVFGSAAERAAGPQPGSWERIKAGERAGEGGGTPRALADIPVALPALTRAAKLGKRAARTGFDWPDAGGARAKIDEELAELAEADAADDPAARHHELGDLLFAVVNLARHLRVNPEQALTDANRRFENRFNHLEAALHATGKSTADCDLETLEAAWQQAKRDLGGTDDS
ncbi:MAG: nucleoside triphosphate pyrophosphohydrolase [Woeseiaceae bacterium]|nr:nucleoside triphosphate pyrophosphohydrolase [Woeseiaceae bacterium]